MIWARSTRNEVNFISVLIFSEWPPNMGRQSVGFSHSLYFEPIQRNCRSDTTNVPQKDDIVSLLAILGSFQKENHTGMEQNSARF